MPVTLLKGRGILVYFPGPYRMRAMPKVLKAVKRHEETQNHDCREAKQIGRLIRITLLLEQSYRMGDCSIWEKYVKAVAQRS